MFILLYFYLGQYGAPTFLWILLYSARGLFLIKEIFLESIWRFALSFSLSFTLLFFYSLTIPTLYVQFLLILFLMKTWTVFAFLRLCIQEDYKLQFFSYSLSYCLVLVILCWQAHIQFECGNASYWCVVVILTGIVI